MLGQLKRLGRDTLIYGLSTVAGRLFNLILLPIHTYYLAPAEFGMVGVLFCYLAFFIIIYSHGMDSAFMRFSRAPEGSEAPPGETRNFSTAFISLAATSLIFSGAIHLAAAPLAAAAGFPRGMDYLIRYAAWILAFDAVSAAPLAELRLTNRPWLFAAIKTANLVINVALNILFVVRLGLGVRGVFLAALFSAGLTLAMLVPVIAGKLESEFDVKIFASFLRFGLPLVPAGLASMAVQVIDRPILKHLTDDATVGIYIANYKLGIFMQLIVEMFDAAWRPFILSKAHDPDAKALMARVLTYFMLGGCAVVLALSLFISQLVALPLALGKPLIQPSYWTGLSIVPVILLAYLLHGLYVNLLAPVFLAKRNDLVVYASALGAAVNIALNFALIPRWGIMGAAAATLAAYAAMASCIFLLGRRVFPVDYEYGRLARIGICFCLLSAAGLAHRGSGSERILYRLGLCAAFPAALAAMGFFRKGEREAFKRLLTG